MHFWNLYSADKHVVTFMQRIPECRPMAERIKRKTLVQIFWPIKETSNWWNHNAIRGYDYNAAIVTQGYKKRGRDGFLPGTSASLAGRHCIGCGASKMLDCPHTPRSLCSQLQSIFKWKQCIMVKIFPKQIYRFRSLTTAQANVFLENVQNKLLMFFFCFVFSLQI